MALVQGEALRRDIAPIRRLCVRNCTPWEARLQAFMNFAPCDRFGSGFFVNCRGGGGLASFIKIFHATVVKTSGQ